MRTRIDYPIGGGSPRFVMYHDPHQTSLENDIRSVSQENSRLRSELAYQDASISAAQREIDALQQQLEVLEIQRKMDDEAEKIIGLINAESLDSVVLKMAPCGGLNINNFLWLAWKQHSTEKFQRVLQMVSDRYTQLTNGRTLKNDYQYICLVTNTSVFDYHNQMYLWDLESSLIRDQSEITKFNQTLSDHDNQYHQVKESAIETRKGEIKTIQVIDDLHRSPQTNWGILVLFVVLEYLGFTDFIPMVDDVVAPVMFGFILLLLSGHSTISACLAGLLGYAVLLWSCVEGTLLTIGDAYVSLSWFSLVVILSFLVRIEYFSEQRKLEMARGELDLYPSEQMNLISFNKRRIEDKFQQKVILHNFSFRLIQAGTSDLAGLNYYYEQTHSGAPIFLHSLIHRAITFCWANKQEYALGFIQANFTEEDNQKYGIMVHNRSFFIPTQG